ncbi:aspartyl-phosphate phosphatase Spo0E family protein [Halobacillus sp. Marseille-P3879]|uniref:aspartyl-phosphate phosphatase Spo0E family protein n=1 Tax=Halobacillus sp. Marseille-P3879 TaxID=2045014 RepID=UPI001F3D72AD|nr:aspartyl-phosphate phosphatase Spo0E family protein [Halobacillus sp. Marseille-P3879]
MDDKEIEKRIEYLRKLMYEQYLNDPTDPRVLETSQSLDELLNELNRRRLTIEKRSKGE